MEVIVMPDAQTASQLVAQNVASLVQKNVTAVLGLATGETPLKLYQELIKLYQQKKIDFSSVTTFNLDEYVGLTQSHPSSYGRYMATHLFDHINIDKSRVHIPNGEAKDIEQECRDYEAAILKAGGIDLQILGLGEDGHIGFNEPISSLTSRTRIKTLMRDTRKANAKFFESEEEVPYHVITMGIQTIMDAKSCYLMAFGEKKANAVASMIEGPISAMCPASILQFHQHTKIYLDEAAASKLSKINYYKWVYEHKPDWQK